MKKVFSKVICAFLCFVTIISLFACDKPDDNGKTEEKFAITGENLLEYKIIVPDKKSSEYDEVAKSLGTEIKSITGKNVEITTDLVNEALGITESEYEIIVGRCDRTATADLYGDIRNKDYGYALVGKKLFIIGEDSEILQKSVKSFNVEILNKAEDKSKKLLVDGESSIKSGDYNYSALKINGVSISEYTIVYPFSPSNTIEEKRVAEELAKWIEINTGYAVSCVRDNKEKSDNEIQIGVTNRITDEMKADMESKMSDGKYYVAKNGQTLWACGNNVSTLSRAVNEIIRSINSDGEIAIDSPVCKEMQSIEVSVMSYNVRGMMDADKRDSGGIITTIKAQSPDIFATQETTSADNAQSAKWISRFKSAFISTGEYDVVLGYKVGNYLAYNPIYYKTDKFELVSSGQKYLSDTPDTKSKVDGSSEYYRIATFAVLRDKTTGIEFLVTCTHLDIAGYIVRTKQATILADLMKEYSLMPVVVCGDFNTDPSTDPIKAFKKNANVEYGADIAEIKPTLNVTTLNGEGQYIELGDKVIDYVFVAKNKITVQKYEHLDNKIGGRYPSDHLPVLASITIYG